MKSIFLFTLLLVAQAAFSASAVNLGAGVINVGDSAEQVLKVAGAPENKDVLETYKGGAAERWYYKAGDKTVTLLIRAGKVIAIPDIKS